MPKWLIYVLVAVGVFLLIEVGLVLAGKKDLAKKLVIPFTLIIGVLVVFLKFRSLPAIRKENERIKRDNEQIKQEHADLQEQIAVETKAHEQKKAELQQKIDENDEKAQRLQENITKMETQGAKGWFEALSAEKQQEILDKTKLPSRKNF